ncbi:hypothetical protein P171DRAFT_485210 [Karstenula rhodostoma CBS 690.94]|uniref:DUF7730 domain-containing protein n=1 Tax=Karstenula rhodostoma CBS 690.94 TaxID=1392251 RepID=A0A9P4UB28_9PLEO|nr:hypothetical protein P171DRAFT_485210 [Karstenula rhodostoma CBS 690.94]
MLVDGHSLAATGPTRISATWRLGETGYSGKRSFALTPKRKKSNKRGAGDEYLPNPKRRTAASVSKKTNKQKDESSFPFLKLPGEIRNMIYQHALTAANNHIDIHRARDEETSALTKPVRMSSGSRKNTSKDIALHLLRVNKQIREEATPLLYSQNNFNFRNARDLSSFLGRHALHVRDLSRIVVWDSLDLRGNVIAAQYMEMAFSLLVFAENLESLELTVDLYGKTDDQIRSAVGSFYRMARNWLQAVGIRKGDKLAAMNILTINSNRSWIQEERHLQLFVKFRDILGQRVAA